MSKDGRLYISKDIRFDECKFPFVNNPNTISPTTNQQDQFSPPPIPLTVVQQLHPNTLTSPLSSHRSESPLFPSLHSGLTSPTTSHESPTTSHESALSSSPSLSQVPLPSSNVHPMITRSKSRQQPVQTPTALLTHAEPTSPKEALAIPHWQAAMKSEYDALIANGTWTLVDLPPPGRTSIGFKWVFQVKENPDGTINKYKVRLVANEFHQQFGQDYTETFSPVVKPVTVRIILTLALTNSWNIQQLDVNNAFMDYLKRRCTWSNHMVFLLEVQGRLAS